MTETPFFFSNVSYRLFGVLHEPKNRSNKAGFVFCHAFAEEKLWSHRVFVNFARELAQRGYTVLRFDYMGHGDSQGHFEDSSIETRLSDIKCAIKTLKEKDGSIKNVGLLGLRFGSTLAAISAEMENDISHLVLWEPIINGSKYMKDLLRINISTQSAIYKEIRHNSEALIQMMKEGKKVNVDGYEIVFPLYEQMIKIDLFDKKKDYSGRTFIAQINKREGPGVKRVEKFSNVYADCQIHEVVEEPFWKEIKHYYSIATNLFQITLKWLKENETRY